MRRGRVHGRLPAGGLRGRPVRCGGVRHLCCGVLRCRTMALRCAVSSYIAACCGAARRGDTPTLGRPAAQNRRRSALGGRCRGCTVADCSGDACADTGERPTPAPGGAQVATRRCRELGQHLTELQPPSATEGQTPGRQAMEWED